VIEAMNRMNLTSELPSVLVASSTTRDSDQLSRSAPMIRKHTRHGAAAISCHWGSPQISVDVAPCAIAPRSLELAVTANQLLRTAGLMQSDHRPEQNDSCHAFGSRDFAPHPPMIHVSIPAHFGVELLLLVGAALHPLHDRHLLFVGLCGSIDAALRDRFDTASLEVLMRFGNQLPKHRMADLYPLFSLIGARNGVSRGVLDRVITDSASSKRPLSIVPSRRQDHGRVSYELDATGSTALSANPMM
jgi:hypothetical protein